ncbi:MAG: hypothetical protein ACREJ5_08360 [Geminicoccaceae bacterium]
MGKAGPSIWAVVLAVLGTATAVAAEPEALQGDRFITVMQNNTLSGETAGGARYDMYFLPGGLVTYRDSTGDDDRGRWRIDDDGDVCIMWTGSDQEHCFRVTLDGDTVAWEGKSGSGRGRLRGGITAGNLEPRSG